MLLGMLLVLAAFVGPTCSIVGHDAFTLDENEIGVDVIAPAAPEVELSEIRRGRGPEGVGCSQQTSSCDDIGIFSLEVKATDDRSADDQLGFVFALHDGELPDGLALPDEPVRPSSGTVVFSWIDGASDSQEQIDFELEVRAIDRGGNVGAPTTIAVRQPTFWAGLDAGWLLLMLIISTRSSRSRGSPRAR
jgi:hypothetical protein